MSSPDQTLRVVGIVLILLFDAALVAALPLIGPLYTTAALIGILILGGCLISDAGFIILLAAISHINVLGVSSFEFTRMLKWGAVAIVGAATILRLLLKGTTVEFKADAVVRYFALYFGWGVFCSLLAIHPMGSLTNVLSKSLFLVVYLFAVFTITKRSHLDLTLAVLLIGVIASCSYSFVELLSGPYHRIAGFMINAGGYSVALMMIVPMLVAAAFIYRRRSVRLIYGVGAAIGIVGIALAWSRATWLMLAAATVTFLILRRQFKLLALLAGLLTAATVFVAINPEVHSVFRQLARLRAGTTHRTSLWDSSLKGVREHPLTGMGPQTLTEDVLDARSADFDTRFFLLNRTAEFNAHNYYLHIMLTTGIPGLLIFLLFIYYLFKHLIRAVKEAPNRESRVFQEAMLALLAAVLVGLFFDTGSLMSSGSYANYFWISLGLTEAIRRNHLLASNCA